MIVMRSSFSGTEHARRSSVTMQFLKEVIDDVQFAGADHLVVDVLADREVEHSEAEGREHHRPVRRYRHPPGHHIVQRAVQEVPVACELLGQVRRGVGLGDSCTCLPLTETSAKNSGVKNEGTSEAVCL